MSLPQVFHKMVNAGVEPNLHTYGALIDGCARAGQVAKAFGAYGIMSSKVWFFLESVELLFNPWGSYSTKLFLLLLTILFSMKSVSFFLLFDYYEVSVYAGNMQ